MSEKSLGRVAYEGMWPPRATFGIGWESSNEALRADWERAAQKVKEVVLRERNAGVVDAVNAIAEKVNPQPETATTGLLCCQCGNVSQNYRCPCGHPRWHCSNCVISETPLQPETAAERKVTPYDLAWTLLEEQAKENGRLRDELIRVNAAINDQKEWREYLRESSRAHTLGLMAVTLFPWAFDQVKANLQTVHKTTFTADGAREIARYEATKLLAEIEAAEIERRTEGK